MNNGNYLDRIGNTILYKIGESMNTKRRLKQLKSREDNRFRNLVEIHGEYSKEERLYIESVARLILSRRGYQRIGNDHFKPLQGQKQAQVIADYTEAIAIAIRTMESMR